MNPSHAFLLASLVLVPVLGAPGLGAQAPTHRWSPTGTDKFVGGANNTVPFWSSSATYQQIHEASDFGETTVTMKGMAMRPWGARTLAGRSWDQRITLSQTQVTASTATTNFASNLGSSNTKVVFATSTSFTKFSWPTSTSTGGTSVVNPPTFTIPFNTTYTYTPSAGNLCWEWRYRNASSNSSMAMDAVNGATQLGTILPSVGKGCTVKGNSQPATAAMYVYSPIVATGHNFRAQLSTAPNDANSILAVGVTKQSLDIGWRTKLELVPLAFVFGKTDAQGGWLFETPMSVLQGGKSFNIYIQYAFADSNQSPKLGLSDLAGYTTPVLPGGHGMTRIYDAPEFGSNGAESATKGVVDNSYGLVVGWKQ